MTSYNLQANREWWAQQWIDLLETSRFKKRLERARNYARQGNVLSIEFKGAKVLAKVQGTDPEPYKVSIAIESFSDENWEYVVETISQKAIFSAQLLAGEMPPNIQEVFGTNGLSLFPFTLSEVRSQCSCPDKVIPCKHIGAVYYLLGDRFSEDPFVLFQLRGRTKEQILQGLRQLRVASTPQAEEQGTSETSQSIALASNPLKIDRFWQYDEPLDPSLVVIVPPVSNETVLDVLGSIPLASEATGNPNSNTNQSVRKYLDEVYQTVSQQAVIAAIG
jgi:uncharacterized Zn finger protein